MSKILRAFLFFLALCSNVALSGESFDAETSELYADDQGEEAMDMDSAGEADHEMDTEEMSSADEGADAEDAGETSETDDVEEGDEEASADDDAEELQEEDIKLIKDTSPWHRRRNGDNVSIPNRRRDPASGTFLWQKDDDAEDGAEDAEETSEDDGVEEGPQEASADDDVEELQEEASADDGAHGGHKRKDAPHERRRTGDDQSIKNRRRDPASGTLLQRKAAGEDDAEEADDNEDAGADEEAADDEDGDFDEVAQILKEFDANKDGKISFAEMQQSEATKDDTEDKNAKMKVDSMFQKQFSVADKDGDGFLVKEELPTFIEAVNDQFGHQEIVNEQGEIERVGEE